MTTATSMTAAKAIPLGGNTKMVANMLEGREVRCGVEYEEFVTERPDIVFKTIHCGSIDAFCDFRPGTLECRSVRFESEILGEVNRQAVAAVNYTAREVLNMRIVVHKRFEFGVQDKTAFVRGYPADWKSGDELYHSICDAKNGALYRQHEALVTWG